MTQPSRTTAAWLGALALALRLPAFAATRHLTFDDGVFGASAVAMRHGGVPFREVFSSQGPLFLPLVWLGDVLGLRTHNAPRLLAVASGVAITVLVYVIGRRVAGRAVGITAALVTTASGSVLWTSGPVAADGPGLALALAALAVVLSHRDDPTTAKAVATGGLVGAAFAIKSLFAIAPGVAIAWVLLEQRHWRRLALAVGASAAVVLVSSLPWGVAGVWDQAVDYHLDAAGARTPGRNASKVGSTLWDRDVLAMALGIAGAGVALASLARRPPAAEPDGRHYRWGGPGGPVAMWLGVTAAVLVLEHPLWRPHLSHLVPPLALAGAYAARHYVVPVAVGLAIVAVGHVATNNDILWPRGYRGDEARAEVALRALPRDALAISDEPGFVWRAGLRTPDDLVDASILRVDSGRLTAASVIDGAADRRVCAVLVWSDRFARFDLGARLAPLGFEPVDRYSDDRILYRRPSCH